MALRERLPGGLLYGLIGCGVMAILVAVCLPLGWLGYSFTQVWYAETKGPYTNRTSRGDLDGDGDLDMVVFTLREEAESIQWGGLALYFNEGEGQFRYFQPELPPELFISGDSGDLDNDGDRDILLLTPARLYLLRNQGGDQMGPEGQFQVSPAARPDFDTGTPGSVKLADLDGDGRLDAFVGGCCGMLLDWPEDPQTFLQPVSWVWDNEPPASKSRMLQLNFLDDINLRDTAIGDLNGDGSPDVWAAVQAPRHGPAGDLADRVLFNDGAGSLYDSGLRFRTGGSSAVALGDLDGDGDLDALVGTPNGTQIWIQQAQGQSGLVQSFRRAEQTLPGGLVQYLFLEDLDGDGDLDALVGEAETARLWWNDGLGGFRGDRQRLDYDERQALGVGDFNGDGALDVFAGASQNSYQLWWNDGQGRFAGD